MKRYLLSAIILLIANSGFSQITLECDYTSTANRGSPMHYHWDISNRISPMARFKMPVGKKPSICVVRPLGGKSKNGKKLISEDTYKWDGEKYVYDWPPLIKQINTVRKNARLHQLMIDNLPWAFQRGLDFKGEKEVETYGNAWPPNDDQAWALYIQAMCKELIRIYGKEQVEQWRFCIGREIGTSGHWRGTRLEFFDHYNNTVKAIHSVLPKAKVGTHFLWGSSKNSFGPDFVKWSKENSVHYDFIGISYYPFYHQKKRVDINHVYKADFAPIKDIPEWNSSATLEIHEFALIKGMSERGNSFENAPNAHQQSFTVMLAKMMYEHGVFNVFRWGTGSNKTAEQAFLTMKSNLYYSSSKKGSPRAAGNMVDAVFALDEFTQQYNIMAYNYNAKPDAKNGEHVKIEATIQEPQGTAIKYRIAVNKDNALNWSPWKTITTKAGKSPNSSKLTLGISLAPFSFQKIEIRTPKTRRLTSAKTKRIVTLRKSGAESEVELIDLKNDQLTCYTNGQRYVIPVSSLSDEDMTFLKEWCNRL